MNRFSALTVVLLSCWLYAGKLFAASPDVEKARQHGAQGQVTIRVADSNGKPVEKAQLSMAFYPSDSYADVVVSEVQTDTNGLYCAEGKTVGDVTYTITKENFYKTRSKYLFYRRGEDCVQGGRWQPWNPTNTVVLKEHRKPIAMYAKNVEVSIPVKGAPVGIDLEIGDWVVPHGKGKEADLFLTYTARVQDAWNFSNQLTIACSNNMNGLYRNANDTESDFRSTYEANFVGYQPQVVLSFATTRERTLTDQRLGNSEYLVFRVRAVLDDKGNIIGARYGKIYGPIGYGDSDNNQGGRVSFTYYLNPTPNDRNLEFDPKRNLFTDLPAGERVHEP